jgi:hypothetical protein
MNEYYFAEVDPVVLFDEINNATIDAARRLEDTVAAGAEGLAPLPQTLIENVTPQASDFQQLFSRLGLAPRIQADQYMRIILLGKSYEMYENTSKQGSVSDVVRFEAGNSGITGRGAVLEELKKDLDHSSRHKEFQPWIMISQNSYEPEARGICEKYIMK